MRDALGDRIKGQYEDRYRFQLPRRTYAIIRVDGKAFHTYTRQHDKPYDFKLAVAMAMSAQTLFSEAQGSAFAYVQSDEISLLVTDFASEKTCAWFDYNVQKICSISASVVTARFNRVAAQCMWDGVPLFDARVFTIPDRTEVENYFVWRQKDAERNSLSLLARSHFSAKELQGKNRQDMHEMLHTVGVNWNDCPPQQRRGIAIYTKDNVRAGIDYEIPTFTQDRAWLSQFIPSYPA